MSKKQERKARKQQQKAQRKQKLQGNVPFWKERRNILAALVLVVITFIGFLPALDAEFTNWDDDLYVTNNPYIAEFTADNVKAIFTTPISGNYNPLTILTFALERHFFDYDPFPYHVNNLLLHLIATILVFWLMRLLKLRFEAAFIAALLFGIHPMRVESVAWITERKDVLFGVFYIGAIISYIYWLQKENTKGRAKYWVVTIVLFILSLLSKIQAVSLPLSLLAIDYYFKRPLKLSLLLEKIPHFGLSLLTGLSGLFFLEARGTLNPVEDFNMLERILFGFYGFGIYIVKVLAPFKISTYYPYPDKTRGALPTIYYLTPLLIAGLAYLVYRSSKQSRAIVFGMVFFFVNVVFLLQILQAGEAFLADRFTYIPYIGLFFIVAWAYQYFTEQRPKFQRPLQIGFALFFMICLGLTYKANGVWKNSATLWTNVIDLYPKVPVAYNNRGTFYRDNGKAEKALQDFNKAISIKNTYHLAYNNRGNVYFSRQDYPKALADYEKVVELNPDNEKAFSNQAAIYFQQKQYDKALENATKALEIEPLYADALMNRGAIYSTIGKHAEAYKDYTTYLKIRKDNALVYNWQSIAATHLGKYQEAINSSNVAVQMQPKNPNFYYNRSKAYASSGNKTAALKDVQQAQNLGLQAEPGYVESLQ